MIIGVGVGVFLVADTDARSGRGLGAGEHAADGLGDFLAVVAAVGAGDGQLGQNVVHIRIRVGKIACKGALIDPDQASARKVVVVNPVGFSQAPIGEFTGIAIDEGAGAGVIQVIAGVDPDWIAARALECENQTR